MQREALEVLEAHVAQIADLVRVLDLLREQLHIVRTKAFDVLGEFRRTEGENVELDDVGEFDEWLDAVAEHEVVECERVTGGHQCSGDFDDVGVDVDVFEDFQDHAIGRQGLAVAVGQERIRHVDERPVRTDERVESDIAEGGQQDLRGRRVRIAQLDPGVGRWPEQQLVGHET